LSRLCSDSADLDASAEAALTAIVKELRDSPHVTLDLEGATDPVGRLDYNIKLSQRRVEVVKRWLVDKGIAPNRIVGATARGPLSDASVKNNLKRRVMVKLMRTESETRTGGNRPRSDSGPVPRGHVQCTLSSRESL
jgi:outer membrane protein OmpA-like peptidoglycan-associated protein